jgi:hypothetical protein
MVRVFKNRNKHNWFMETQTTAKRLSNKHEKNIKPFIREQKL